MKTLLTTIITIALFSLGCTACGPDPINPCDDVTCSGNGTCVADNDIATCECNSDHYGESCDEYDPCRNIELNPDEWLASMSLSTNAIGRLTVNLPTENPNSSLNGTYLDVIHPNTVTEKVWFVIGLAGGAAIPSEYFSLDLDGVELKALVFDQVKKYNSETDRCDWNEVQLNPTVMSNPDNRPEIFVNRVGSALFHNGTSWVYPGSDFNFTISEAGVSIRTSHFSPYYVPNQIPELVVKAAWADDQQIIHFNFEDSQDELIDLANFKMMNGSTPVDLIYEGTTENPYLYRTTTSFPLGTHNLTASVEGYLFDQYAEDSAELAVDVTVTETCAVDSCNNNGTCDDSSGSITCSCDEGWDPSSNCGTCTTGYLGTDCHADWCESNTCDNGGVCTAEACDCSATGGYSGTYCEVPPAPTITNLAIDCSGTSG